MKSMKYIILVGLLIFGRHLAIGQCYEQDKFTVKVKSITTSPSSARVTLEVNQWGQNQLLSEYKVGVYSTTVEGYVFQDGEFTLPTWIDENIELIRADQTLTITGLPETPEKYIMLLKRGSCKSNPIPLKDE